MPEVCLTAFSPMQYDLLRKLRVRENPLQKSNATLAGRIFVSEFPLSNRSSWNQRGARHIIEVPPQLPSVRSGVGNREELDRPQSKANTETRNQHFIFLRKWNKPLGQKRQAYI